MKKNYSATRKPYTSKIENRIIKLHQIDKMGAQAIANKLTEEFNENFSRAPVGKRIKALKVEGKIKDIPYKDRKASIDQRREFYGKPAADKYLAIREVKDIDRRVLLKLSINAALNPITAIYRVKNGEALEGKAYIQLKNIVSECFPFFEKRKIYNSEKEYLNTVIKASENTALNINSMLSDKLSGRKTEVNEILGVINYFRIGFLNEMGMIPPSGFVSEYKSIPTLIINAPIIFLQGIFSPGFGLGGLNLVFFPESILYIVLFILGARRSNYFSESLNWLVFFVFCVGIVLNSIVVENDSTFLRYRFTFIYLLMTHLLLFMGKKETKLPREDIKTIYQF